MVVSVADGPSLTLSPTVPPPRPLPARGPRRAARTRTGTRTRRRSPPPWRERARRHPSAGCGRRRVRHQRVARGAPRSGTRRGPGGTRGTEPERDDESAENDRSCPRPCFPSCEGDDADESRRRERARASRPSPGSGRIGRRGRRRRVDEGDREQRGVQQVRGRGRQPGRLREIQREEGDRPVVREREGDCHDHERREPSVLEQREVVARRFRPSRSGPVGVGREPTRNAEGKITASASATTPVTTNRPRQSVARPAAA